MIDRGDVLADNLRAFSVLPQRLGVEDDSISGDDFEDTF
jgi:hypothetical protein